MLFSWFPGAQLHRKDNSQNYSPENCIWLSCSDHAKETAKQNAIGMSERMLGHIPWNKGISIKDTHPQSDETRKKNSKFQKNSEWITNGTETRKIQKDQEIPVGWKRGRCDIEGLTNQSRLGQPHSEETKTKIGIKHKGKITSDETKRKISETKRRNFQRLRERSEGLEN